MVFDCESVGLHGECFAVGWVVAEYPSRREISCGLAWCDPRPHMGTDDGWNWISHNVPPLPALAGVGDTVEVRNRFWSAWLREVQEDSHVRLAVDVPWPVESRFLIQCVDDFFQSRSGGGPYPLYDIASIRLAAGYSPTGTYTRNPGEMPAHNPICDARQSARLLFEALEKLPAWTPKVC